MKATTRQRPRGTSGSTPCAAAAAVLLASLVASTALAAPALRFKVDQKGDFTVFGNTVGYDCAAAVPAPVLGTVGTCGNFTTDTSPDVFWRADEPSAGVATASSAITAANARSTAVLKLPPGAIVSYARLYWSATRSGAATDTTALVERIGTGAFSTMVTADGSATAVPTAGGHTYYQSTANVTSLLQLHGPGAYRVGNIDSLPLTNDDDTGLYAAWTMVVFYTLDTDPLRNLTLFDGLDLVEPSIPTVSVALSGFLVPSAGFDAKLGVIAYEGDSNLTGDSMAFNGTKLFNATNPVMNFFNATRTNLGTAVSNVGDLPQLSGAPRSMGGYDQDVLDVTTLLKMGDTSATIQVETNNDFFILGAFVTSISTFKPNFTSTNKTFTNLNRTDGTVRPGDVLEYTVVTTNEGNDPGVGVIMNDVLPAGLTLVPGMIRVTTGANMGTKSDAAGDDQADYDAGTHTITVRLGMGANATQGGTIAVGASTTVVFRASVNADAAGTIANQAVVTASGQSGALPTVYPSDGNGVEPGTPPTVANVDQCMMDSDCPQGRFCLKDAHPYVCIACRTNADCADASKPVCDTGMHVCRACGADSECGAATPACHASGRCVVCTAANTTKCVAPTPLCDVPRTVCGQCTTSADCSGLTPLCMTATSTCVPCTDDGPAGGCVDPKRPACNKTGNLAGACTECSATNGTLCSGAKPQCQTSVGLCGCSDRDGDSECGTAMSGIICNGPVGICTPGCSEAAMRNRCPTGQSCSVMGGGVGICLVSMCNADPDCASPRPRCDLAVNPRVCVECLADADCKTGYVCDVAATKTCVECTTTQKAACTAQGAGTRCLANDTCGCQADSECGGTSSGRVCDSSVSKCTYGCRGMGGNGCPAGLVCSSTNSDLGRCLSPGADAGAADAAGADAASDAAVATTDAGRDGGTSDGRPAPDAAESRRDGPPAAEAGEEPATPDASTISGGYIAGGGCKCDVSRPGQSPVSWWPALAPLALLLRRRRR